MKIVPNRNFEASLTFLFLWKFIHTMATTSVDYRDFSLVYKAFHLKENAPNGMICRCGLEKEDTVFSKDEERDSEENIGGLRLFSSYSFRIETIMVPTCDDDFSSTEILKKLFRGVGSPYKILMWCGRLLIEFHEENQCSRYLSSALKFYVKAIEIYKEARYPLNILPFRMKIQKLLRLSSKFCVHQSVFLELLRLFIINGFYNMPHSLTIDDVLLFEDIFRAANELKLDILVLWKKVDSRSYISFNWFIYEHAEFLIPLIKFGKIENVSGVSGFCLQFSLFRLAKSIIVDIDYECNSTTFRALQTLRLFFLAKSDMDPTIGPYAVKLLWNSITEPFLCQEEFKKSVKAIETSDRLTYAWDWYVNHVLENVISPRGPRSLAHLSRCSVRGQLATCLQLPCGVDQLNVPKILKDYILLEH
ncbi:uncharacterized protein [Parasteatoda tepidariorum]|uniref:uncharacterized protein isoform X2 n=1 Tax=Parasteatoda tepidariorum TaxID=114398 RepID=UPI001C724A21|nr:uncharacterized protein LOC122270833 [Parasteatoda tepidariorum]